MRMVDHPYQCTDYPIVFLIKSFSGFRFQVTTSDRKFDPALRLCRLRSSIAQFADEMGFIPSFAPGFGEIGADGPGRAAELVREGVGFFFWKGLALLEDLHSHLKCFLVDLQVTVVHYLHFPYSRISPFTPSPGHLVILSSSHPLKRQSHHLPRLR